MQRRWPKPNRRRPTKPRTTDSRCSNFKKSANFIKQVLDLSFWGSIKVFGVSKRAGRGHRHSLNPHSLTHSLAHLRMVKPSHPQSISGPTWRVSGEKWRWSGQKGKLSGQSKGTTDEGVVFSVQFRILVRASPLRSTPTAQLTCMSCMCK